MIFGAVVSDILRGRRADLLPSPRERFHLLYKVSELRFSRDLEKVRSFSISLLRSSTSAKFTSVVISVGEYFIS